MAAGLWLGGRDGHLKKADTPQALPIGGAPDVTGSEDCQTHEIGNRSPTGNRCQLAVVNSGIKQPCRAACPR